MVRCKTNVFYDSSVGWVFFRVYITRTTPVGWSNQATNKRTCTVHNDVRSIFAVTSDVFQSRMWVSLWTRSKLYSYSIEIQTIWVLSMAASTATLPSFSPPTIGMIAFHIVSSGPIPISIIKSLMSYFLPPFSFTWLISTVASLAVSGLKSAPASIVSNLVI